MSDRPLADVSEKFKQVCALAETRYGVNMSNVRLSFDLKGRVAGWASRKGAVYSVRLNKDMITRGNPEVLKNMIEDTVPHELAHIVCFMKPELGRNHDYGWQSVCRALGGTGKRLHDVETVRGRGATYEYTSSHGHKIRVGERHHQRIQRGERVLLRKGKGSLYKGCAFSIVGIDGKTLAAPIVKQAVSLTPLHCVVDPAPVQRVRVVFNDSIRPVVKNPEGFEFTIHPTTSLTSGESKASISRRIMLAGYKRGESYEQIIAAMIAANGYDRQLARATFKANAPKVGIPSSFYR